MNIIAIMPSYRPKEYSFSVGGGEISNRILLEGLAAKGHNVTVLTWNAGGFDSGNHGGVTVQELGAGYQGRHFRLITLASFKGLALEYIKANKKPDVIVCGTTGLGVALELIRIVPVPVGLFVRAFENFEIPHGILSLLVRRTKAFFFGEYGSGAVAKTDFLLPNSKFMEEYCFRHLGKKMPSAVVYPPLDELRRVAFNVKPIHTIAMVGTSTKKGFKLVEYLAKKFPLVEFRILGSKSKVKNSMILPGNLNILGWSNIQEEFSFRADAVLVPSLWEEPFGRVAIEALASGKPPLVSDIGGLPEAVSHERMLCLPPGNQAAWVQAIGQLIEDPEPFVMSAKRATSYLNHFSAGKQIGRLEGTLQLEVEKFRNHFIQNNR